jgi:hypothetical protein
MSNLADRDAIEIGGGDDLISSSQLGNLDISNIASLPINVYSALAQESNGFVVGERKDSYVAGFQKQTDDFRIGGFVNTEGEASLVGEFKHASANEDFYFSTSAELSTNSDNNHFKANIGGYKDVGDFKFSGKAGVGAFGSNPNLHTIIAGEAEYDLSDSGMTTAFASATARFGGHDQIDFKTGIRHGIFEAGIKHDNVSHDTQGFVGLTKSF